MKKSFVHESIPVLEIHSPRYLSQITPTLHYQLCRVISPQGETSISPTNIGSCNTQFTSVLTPKYSCNGFNTEKPHEEQNVIPYQRNMYCFGDSSGKTENLAYNQALRRKFTPEEDKRLTKLISLNGSRRWDQIALLMPGRTGRQCRDRFHNYLRPTLKNGPWTQEEDLLLQQKVSEIGRHWNKISRFFNGRSANNIKNRWYTYIDKNHRYKNCPIIEDNHDNNHINEDLGLNESPNLAGNSPTDQKPGWEKEETNEFPDMKQPLNEVIDERQNNNLKMASAGRDAKIKVIFPPINPPNDSLFAGMDIDSFSKF